jgi:glycerol-3-phosphate acyltransferase PlsY
MPIYELVLLIIGAYLFGSIPTSYLAGRLLKGIDIRKHGSGVASASNVWHSVARWAMFPVGLFDVFKGAIPVAIAYPVLDFPLWAQGIVGMAAITGHNWSAFLGFSGGRGIATIVGVISIIAPWELLVYLVVVFPLHAVLKNSPLSMLIAAVVVVPASIGLPAGPLVNLTAGSFERTWCLLGILVILILKRLMAERPLPRGEWKRVMLYRLLFDRDTRNRESWIYRGHNHDDQNVPEKR